MSLKKLSLMLVLLGGLAGCAKVEDQMVAGDYTGFFGDRDKVGFAVTLQQTGNQVSGEPTLSWNTSRTGYSFKGKLEGTVKGDEVKLKIHGQDEPFEIEMNCKHTSLEGYFALVGDDAKVSGSGKVSEQLKHCMFEGKLHFQFKTDVAVTQKKN